MAWPGRSERTHCIIILLWYNVKVKCVGTKSEYSFAWAREFSVLFKSNMPYWRRFNRLRRDLQLLLNLHVNSVACIAYMLISLHGACNYIVFRHAALVSSKRWNNWTYRLVTLTLIKFVSVHWQVNQKIQYVRETDRVVIVSCLTFQ